MGHTRYRPRIPGLLIGIALALIVVAGCGPTSQTDTPATITPQTTDARPTVPGATETAAVNTDSITIVRSTSSTPTETVATPEPTDSVSTPVERAGAATPIPTSGGLTLATPIATPMLGQVEKTGRETYTNPGDGTGGSGMVGERSSNLPEDQDEVAATPSVVPASQLKVVGCEIPDIPVYDGLVTDFVLTAELNFRSGPGVNCEPLRDEPLPEDQVVTAIGGPVKQIQDDSDWIQITVDDETGWISTEFIVPADE